MRKTRAPLKVLIADRQRDVAMSRRELTALARAAAPARWGGRAVSIVLVGGGEMTELNRRFTRRDGDTDVLAFDLESPGDGTVGEVIVNAARALSEARARGVAPAEELALYVVHGLTHLQGFDDHCTADRKRMYDREETVMAAAGWAYVRRRARRAAGGGKKP